MRAELALAECPVRPLLTCSVIQGSLTLSGAPYQDSTVGLRKADRDSWLWDEEKRSHTPKGSELIGSE